MYTHTHDFSIRRHPYYQELNRRLSNVILAMAENEPDFRTTNRTDIDSASWQDRHQYFSLDSSWHSRDDLYLDKDFQDICDFIKSIVPSNVCFTSMWAKVAKKGNRGTMHRHRGIISGVYYVDIGSEQSACVNFYHNDTKHAIEPKNGDIITFPAWMFHDVDAYKGLSPRINLSWNMS